VKERETDKDWDRDGWESKQSEISRQFGGSPCPTFVLLYYPSSQLGSHLTMIYKIEGVHTNHSQSIYSDTRFIS
jgi:hypothetical protein